MKIAFPLHRKAGMRRGLEAASVFIEIQLPSFLYEDAHSLELRKMEMYLTGGCPRDYKCLVPLNGSCCRHVMTQYVVMYQRVMTQYTVKYQLLGQRGEHTVK